MPWERIYSAANEQSNALNAAAHPECTRDLMAEFYADCLKCDRTKIDWAALNAAILKRWPKGLKYIKERAWKEAQCER